MYTIRRKRGGKMNRLLSLRKEMKYTQDDIANLLMIPRTTYSAYEQGKRGLPIDILIMLADIYETSTDYILERTDIQTSFNNIIGIILTPGELNQLKKKSE